MADSPRLPSPSTSGEPTLDHVAGPTLGIPSHHTFEDDGDGYCWARRGSGVCGLPANSAIHIKPWQQALGRYKRRRPRENERVVMAYDIERVFEDFSRLIHSAEQVRREWGGSLGWDRGNCLANLIGVLESVK